MPSPIYETELNAHLGALLADIAAAGVPYLQTGSSVESVVVLLRPTMAFWRVPFAHQRFFEQRMRKETPPWWVLVPTQTARGTWQGLAASLFHVAEHAAHWGRLESCLDYHVWQTGVIAAFMRHGWYDPTTNHTPPADRQLDAIEHAAAGRDLWLRSFPGLDLWRDPEPTTEESDDEAD